MSGSISATRDHINGQDKGDLINPAQAASFTSDPLLAPVTTSALPKPMLPDPTPSDNPELFDKSTAHLNTHYHPEVKLSKKKRAKKLGVGYVPKQHGGPHGASGVHAGGRTFSEHEKAAHEREERRDAAIGASEEQEDDDDDEDEEDETEEEEQSHKQHHENRITGTEKGEKHPASRRNEGATAEEKNGEDDEQDKKAGDEQEKENGDNPTLLQRATGVLSSAQQKATGVATGVASTVMSTAQSVPVVGALLSKVGLGSSKTDDKAEDGEKDNAGEKEVDSTGGKQEEQLQQSEQGQDKKRSQGQAGGDNDARSKVGGAKEADTEATQASAGQLSQPEAATRGGGETFGKQGARADNHEGALDKSRSHAGQKAADNMKSVNKQAKKEEEA